MSRRTVRMAIAAVVAISAALVVWNQIEVYFDRQARAALMLQRHPPLLPSPEVLRQRQALFAMLQPVAFANCELQRFGEPNDGGYLMCANLLDGIGVGYSYGIAGYDQWGCDISTRFDVRVHQYDCFDPTRPACGGGDTVFHDECVGDSRATIDGRPFDTIANHFARNQHPGRRVVLKIDVEGAEWDSLMSTPDDLLAEIDQMAVEFHWIEDGNFKWVGEERYLRVIERLKQFFEVAHIHFNNASCVGDLAPFPSWAYEVLFVSKRLAVVDPARRGGGTHPLDAQNNRAYADCQPAPIG